MMNSQAVPRKRTLLTHGCARGRVIIHHVAQPNNLNREYYALVAAVINAGRAQEVAAQLRSEIGALQARDNPVDVDVLTAAADRLERYASVAGVEVAS